LTLGTDAVTVTTVTAVPGLKCEYLVVPKILFNTGQESKSFYLVRRHPYINKTIEKRLEHLDTRTVAVTHCAFASARYESSASCPQATLASRAMNHVHFHRVIGQWQICWNDLSGGQAE